MKGLKSLYIHQDIVPLKKWFPKSGKSFKNKKPSNLYIPIRH